MAPALLRSSLRIAATCSAAALLLLAPLSARAVEVTDVLDAFDDQNNDPFDFALRLRFTSDSRSSTIAREVKCVAADQLGSVCPSGSGIVLAKELEYSRVRNTLNIDARFGLFKDVELFVVAPIVLSDFQNHTFASGVTSANSTLEPPSKTEAVMAGKFDGKQRAGFGDMQFGVKVAPFNHDRDPSEPTWLFGVTYTAPTGTAMTVGNEAVGYGVHELQLYTTISRRALQFLEPFFNLHATPVRSGTDKGLFVSHGVTQPRIDPGFNVGTQFGITFVPWENTKEEARLEIETGFSMDYFGRGRGYSEVWEALASPKNPCQPEIGCTNTLHSKSDVDETTGKQRKTDGLTEIEAYTQFTGWGALHYQPIANVQISARVGYVSETPHFITFGEYGKDLDGQNGVSQANKYGQNEYSPTYLPSVDAPGQRLRVQDVSTLGLMFAATGKF